MGGSYSRRKGHNFERWVAAQFREHGFPNAKRGQQTRFGSDAPDVDGTPYWIECKVGKHVYPVKAYQQAYAARRHRPSEAWRPIVVVAKVDRQTPLIYVSEESRLVDLVPFIATGPMLCGLDRSLFFHPLETLLPLLPKEF